MFTLSVATGHDPITRYAVCATRDTFAECEAWLRSYFTVAHYEADADYPGCADFITNNGVVGKIEPVGFTLAGAA